MATDQKQILIEQIRQVMADTNFSGCWGELRDALNSRGARPLKAERWTTSTTLRNFCCLKNREKFADLLPAEAEGGQLPDTSPDVTKTSAHEELPEPSPQSTKDDAHIDYPEVANTLPKDSAHDAYPAVTEELPEATEREGLPIVTHELPTWLNPETWEVLRQMVENFQQRGGEPVLQARPIFKIVHGGKENKDKPNWRRNSGIHVMNEILDRAAAKAARERALTGGSLSLLIEILLWRYIGSPEDLLEQLPTGSPDVTKD